MAGVALTDGGLSIARHATILPESKATLDGPNYIIRSLGKRPIDVTWPAQ